MMRYVKMAFKLWLGFALIAAVAIGVLLLNEAPFGGPIRINDEVLTGPDAAFVIGAVGLIGALVFGFVLALVAALLAVILPVVVGLVIVAIGLGLAGAVLSLVTGGAIAALPLLLIVGLCVVLYRFIVQRPTPSSSSAINAESGM